MCVCVPAYGINIFPDVAYGNMSLHFASDFCNPTSFQLILPVSNELPLTYKPAYRQPYLYATPLI